MRKHMKAYQKNQRENESNPKRPLFFVYLIKSSSKPILKPPQPLKRGRVWERVAIAPNAFCLLLGAIKVGIPHTQL